MNISDFTINQLQAEIERSKSAKVEAEGIARDLSLRLTDLQREINRRLKPAPEPRVSDHALFRYMERVYEIDVEAIRKEILTDNCRDALKAGATGYSINGIKFRAKNGTLVTVIN